jgi:hypothetical protein
MPQLLFGGIIAVILLGFYIWSIIDAVTLSRCAEKAVAAADCTDAATIIQCKQKAVGAARCGSFTINMSFISNIPNNRFQWTTAM